MGCCEYRPPCHRCTKRCVGEIVKRFRVYERCCHEVVAVCCFCGHEYEHRRHQMCPRCGAPADDPPMGGRFGGFGEEQEESEDYM